MITDNLDYPSHMCLKLTCKNLCSMVEVAYAWWPTSWIYFSLLFEQSVPRSQRLPVLICTLCATLCPRAMFSDSQNRKTCPTRFCIKCGVDNGKYVGANREFLVGKVPSFACAACRQAVPLDQEASYGKARSGIASSYRWCKSCWRPISGYLAVETGKLGMLAVYEVALGLFADVTQNFE